MTREEAVTPFELLAANWPFLDFTNPSLFEAWFGTLRNYPVEEVQAGIQDMIANVKETPNAAVAHEYVDKVRSTRRRAEQEYNRQLYYKTTVACKNCNDKGYVTIFFPNGYEYIEACDCKAGHARFGQKFFDMQNRPGDPKEIQMLFEGTREDDPVQLMKRYKKVRYVDGRKGNEIAYRWERRQ